VQVLRELNSAGRTTVPMQATATVATPFVPARWRGYLDTTRGQGRGRNVSIGLRNPRR
jgi:hypothetical protein